MLKFNLGCSGRLLIFKQFLALHKQGHVIHRDAVSSHILLRKSLNEDLIRIIAFRDAVSDHQCEWSAQVIPGAHRPKEGVFCQELFFLEKNLKIWHYRKYSLLSIIPWQFTDKCQLAFFEYKGHVLFEYDGEESLKRQKKVIDERLAEMAAWRS